MRAQKILEKMKNFNYILKNFNYILYNIKRSKIHIEYQT